MRERQREKGKERGRAKVSASMFTRELVCLHVVCCALVRVKQVIACCISTRERERERDEREEGKREK